MVYIQFDERQMIKYDLILGVAPAGESNSHTRRYVEPVVPHWRMAERQEEEEHEESYLNASSPSLEIYYVFPDSHFIPGTLRSCAARHTHTQTLEMALDKF